jgi:hypothetical protein
MAFVPDKHNLHSMRLRGYDCARDGAYFMTIRAAPFEHKSHPTSHLLQLKLYIEFPFCENRAQRAVHRLDVSLATSAN